MDHIPTPRFPKHPTPEISCFARPKFSCSNTPHFDKYPESRGWDRAALVRGDFAQGHTEDESRAFLQEWLYFKFLAALLGIVRIEVDMDDFTRRSNGRLILDSTSLIRQISEFERRFRELDMPTMLSRTKLIRTVLRNAQRIILRECSMLSAVETRSQSWPFDSMTSLSFMVLGSTLTFATSRIIQVLNTRTDEEKLAIFREHGVWHHQWGVSGLLYDRMRSDGWCPHRMAQFASGERSVIGMYYGSLLDIPQDGHDHTYCKVRECHHTQINEAEYETRHENLLPCCLPVIPDREKIIKPLKSSGLPLLKISIGSDSNIQTEVVQFESGMKYVAISHVWAHGLGNVYGNWLPHCQMQRLYEFVAALYPFTSMTCDVLVWIDTICVPRKNKGDEKDYRKIAIDLLAETYRGADKVLVLDDQIIRSSSEVTAEESLVRILSSGWMTRLWTLQESLLAKRRRFQFRERAVEEEDLLSNVLPLHHSSIWWEVHEFFSSFRVLPKAAPKRRLQRLWNYLQWRSTSHASDEAICLSILTDKQPSIVQNGPLANRMKNFFRQLDGVPSDIVFMPGPRLPNLGWGWAPTSFMARYQWTSHDHFQETLIAGAADHTISDQTNISQIFDKGLRVHYPGILLLSRPRRLDVPFSVKAKLGKAELTYHVVCSRDEHLRDYWHINLESLKSPTLILQAFPRELGAIRALLADAYERPPILGEVPVDKTAQIVVPTRFICRATVNELVPEEFDIETRSYFRDEPPSRSCEGTILDQQWWYIG